MTQTLVLVAAPMTRDNLWALAFDGRAPHLQTRGFAPTDGLAQAFGVELGEEAELAALQMADVAGLAAGNIERLVIVAEVPSSRVVADSQDEAADGAVLVSRLMRDECRAFFTGECDAAVAQAAEGLGIDAAWELPAVQKLLSDQPLGWHDISELDAWLGEPYLN
ncbi:MAG: hypothetical protein FWD80_02290 [Propionibacteriaceae bacterium]|nr:hypothetical protein [Propionibacteriaceae bacterium]